MDVDVEGGWRLGESRGPLALGAIVVLAGVAIEGVDEVVQVPRAVMAPIEIC